jgi:hypothetical protein
VTWNGKAASASSRKVTAEAGDEALVLSDLLGRWIDRDKAQDLLGLVADDAEIWALNAVNCLLESELVEPFRPDNGDLVAGARERLRERNGGTWPWRDKG